MSKKILLLIPSMTGVGGTERVVHSLSKLLTQAGAEVHQASFDPPGVQRHFEGTTPLHALGPLPRVPLPLRPVFYWLAASRLARLKRRIGVDVTISNLWSADLINALSGGADRKVALCHTNVVGNPANLLMLQLRPLVAAVYHRFQEVIAVNEGLASELTSLYGLEYRPVTHIDNFAEVSRSASAFPRDGVTRFVWCGRFVLEKNVQGLLHAWSSYAFSRSDAQLVLVGDGPLREELQTVAASLGLSWTNDLAARKAKVVWVGKVDDPIAYMVGARALLLTSHAEGLPMVILEALALGVPVLAADCHAGGVRTAMVGSGSCDPRRTEAERSLAGALLPVPAAGDPATLALWRAALEETCDETRWQQWRSGALQRATIFDSATAMSRWSHVLGLQQEGA